MGKSKIKNMKSKTILWIGIYGVVAYGAYYLFFSKNAYAKKIIANGKFTGSLDTLKSFDMGFLRAWSISASKNEPAFSYKDVTYNTQGGKAKK
jgi:hypothetical protein